MRHLAPLASLLAAFILVGCGETADLTVAEGTGPNPKLPGPDKTLFPTVKIAEVRGWPKGGAPAAAPSLEVKPFAQALDHPRWLHLLPNGDVLVAESNAPPKPKADNSLRGWFMKMFMKKAGAGVPSANRITLLRDVNGDGFAEMRSPFLTGLNSPFGMALVGGDFYVANTDAVVRFAYTPGDTRLTGPGTKLVALPAGPRNHHWTKSLIASPDGARLYATVGSNSNVGENGMDEEVGRAAIWEIDRVTGRSRIFASGLRNPNGLGWEPASGALWTAVNERDEIGSDLVPDYMTSVKDGGFYGWPYSYYGDNVDERVKPPRPDLVARAIKPDYALGPHTASLGLAFGRPGTLTPAFASGVFIGQHGSWNRNPPSGYKVIFVPFAGGKPTGAPVDVLTGFLDGEGKALGRPVGVALDGRGGLLVADDVGNTIWRVTASASGNAPAASSGR